MSVDDCFEVAWQRGQGDLRLPISDLRFGFLDCDGSGDLRKLVEFSKGGAA